MAVIVHVEPHAEKQSLHAADQGEHQDHGVDVGDVPFQGPDVKQANGQRDADGNQEKGQQVKEHQGMKILDDVLEKQPPPESDK